MMLKSINLTNYQFDLLDYIQGLFSKPVYLVGGAVRDIILNKEPKDYDFCSSLTPDEIKSELKGKHKTYLVGEKHGTIAFKVDGEVIEITTFRTEVYSDSRKPTVKYIGDITQDLSRRDYTINAIAIRCDSKKIIDPFGGVDDLNNKILKTVGNSKIRFKEDPLRILRGVRIAAKYDLTIEAKTAERLKKMSNLLLKISKERWMDELSKILLLPNVSLGLELLWEFNIFMYVIPELQLQYNYDQNSIYHKHVLHEHTKLVVSATPVELIIRWAALLHDIGKPFVRSENKNGYSNYINHEVLGGELVERLARHLKWSNNMRLNVVELVRDHLLDDSPLKPYDNQNKL